MTKDEFAQKIKEKYPQYASMDSIELADRFVTKYPVYKQFITADTAVQPESTNEGAPGIVRGLGQSAGNLLKGAGEMGQDILQNTAGRVVEKITSTPKEQLGTPAFEKGTDVSNKLDEAFTPETSGEKIGNLVGDVAQFVIPATQVAKAQKGMSLAKKIVGQAVSDTGVQAVREGELNKDVAETAILSLAFPAAIAGGQMTLKKALGKSDGAAKIINSLIKPASKEFSYGKNPGKAVAEEGIIAGSLDELVNKIDDVIQGKSQEYKNLVQQSGAVVNVSDAFSPIEDAIKTAVKQNNQGLVNRLNTIKLALTNNLGSTIDDAGNEVIKSMGAKQLDNLTADQLVDLKREIGELTSFTGNPSDDKLVNKALKSIYGNIKSKIDEAVPGSSSLSEKIASLISAKTATANRINILERQNLGNFTGKVLGGAGVLSTIFTGNPVGALIGLGAAGIENAMGTPAFKTRFAKFISGATQSQKDELFKAMPGLRAIINRELGQE